MKQPGDSRMYQILTDKEVEKYYNFSKIVSIYEKIFVEKNEGTYISPPRHSVKSEKGSLVFTIGGSSSEVENAIGFRVYDTFPEIFGQKVEKPQLNVVFNNTSGELMGIIIGNLIGPIRTAAINALAIKKMSNKNATTLGVIGTGNQARWHVEAVCAVRNVKQIKVFSRRPELCEKFASSMSDRLKIETTACSTSKQAVKDVDILLCLTTSRTPVFNSEDISQGTHINTIGPKFVDAHEIPLDLIPKTKFIVTDSIEQTKSYSRSFFLTGTPTMDSIIELSDIVSEKVKLNRQTTDISLFSSVGLSGTEVVLSKFILQEFSKNKN